MHSHNDLACVLEELQAREPIFHRQEFGTSRSDFEHMTMPDFWEVGASGSHYSREFVLDLLETRHSAPQEDIWNASEFRCQELAPELFLLTYRLVQNRQRVTHRSTIWRRTADGWKIVFHQGTIITSVK